MDPECTTPVTVLGRAARPVIGPVPGSVRTEKEHEKMWLMGLTEGAAGARLSVRNLSPPATETFLRSP
jgi:hypothetical protein